MDYISASGYISIGRELRNGKKKENIKVFLSPSLYKIEFSFTFLRDGQKGNEIRKKKVTSTMSENPS